MRRREFIGLVGGAAAWPVVARAQQGERVRSIGVLLPTAEDDADTKARLSSFRLGLQRFRWAEGRNIHLDIRYADGHPSRFLPLVKELVALKPEVIFASTTPVVAALLHESSTIPIVFVSVSDPIGYGFIASMARPGRNATGMSLYEEGIAGKWLAMLKEITPGTTRAALLADSQASPFDYFVRSARATASPLGIEVVPTPISNAAEIEQAIAAFASVPNGALVLLPSTTNVMHKDLIIELAARHKLPAVYFARFFTAAGGLMSYGTNVAEQCREAASYVDRILRGANPADLPVQAPIKYETVVNLKTAKALGFAVPASLLVRADEVIE